MGALSAFGVYGHRGLPRRDDLSDLSRACDDARLLAPAPRPRPRFEARQRDERDARERASQAARLLPFSPLLA